MKERIEKYFEKEKEKVIFYSESKLEDGETIVAEILIKTVCNSVIYHIAIQNKENIKMSSGAYILTPDIFSNELDSIYDENNFVTI